MFFLLNVVKNNKIKWNNWFESFFHPILQQFERDLRRFARVERNMLLDNHVLYDKTKVSAVNILK